MTKKYKVLTLQERAIWVLYKDGWKYSDIAELFNKTEKKIQTTCLSVANYLGDILLEFRVNK